MLTSPLLGGGYLRRPASLTIGVGTLRALCQEWNRLENLENLENLEYLEYLENLDCGNKKREATSLLTSPLLGGGYLLSHFRSTIGVVRLNFSVRNGKRWDPHAMTTLFLPFQPGRRTGCAAAVMT